MITVFIADDHKLFREGLKTLIEKDAGLTLIGEANDGFETLQKLGTMQPDVLLLDLAMPGLGGLEVVTKLVKEQPAIKILIVTMHKDSYLAFDAIRSGASGYLLKDEGFSKLCAGIKAVMQGKMVVADELEANVRETLESYAKNPNGQHASQLTDREREILRLVAEGFTNQKIADALFISVATVDTHRKNIMKKLKIHNIAGLVKYAVKNRIICLETNGTE